MNGGVAKPFAVVTGASSGIGFELAKQFVLHGYDLLITSYSQDPTQATETLTNLGAHVENLQVDLATLNGVETLYRAIQDTGRPVDAIAINAGRGLGGDFTRQTSVQDEIGIINLNVVSTVYLAKLVLQDMVERNSGRVLFTSSIAARMPGAFQAVYNASKAFVQSFAEALRNELKDTNITITALQPGPTDTRFFERAGMTDTKVGSSDKDDPAEVAKQGFEALMHGKDHVVAASLGTKLQGAASAVLPEPIKAEQHRKMAEPGSGE